MFTIIIIIISFLFPSSYVFCYRGIWSTKSAYERPCDPRPFLLTQHLGIATTAHWDSIWPLIFDLSCHYCLYVMAPFWMYIWVSSHQNPLFPRTDNKIYNVSTIALHDCISPLNFKLWPHMSLYVRAPVWMYIWMPSHQQPFFREPTMRNNNHSSPWPHLWTLTWYLLRWTRPLNFDPLCHCWESLPWNVHASVSETLFNSNGRAKP